ncbi:hypothetical protein EVAR_19839_1 [Eumeta japonica]|uniref:Uncharacterized protein n=1 Tax=Eumeta variegata TaxID=151549 RepID=A0A4C1UQS9_EUMVA|nr:hypothetical protein EVAR_19839_1 [Eumeta japonica]
MGNSPNDMDQSPTNMLSPLISSPSPVWFATHSVATRRHSKRRHANNPVYPALIDVSHQKDDWKTHS